MKMHYGEVDIDAELVRGLVAAQLPHLTHLPISAVQSTGTVNAIYRLGEHLYARLPRMHEWAQDLDSNHSDDRVTFRLRPGDLFQIVFHRGAKVRADTDDFSFEDGSGLLEWVARDRATVTFRDLDDVQAKLPTVVELVGRWMRAAA